MSCKAKYQKEILDALKDGETVTFWRRNSPCLEWLMTEHGDEVETNLVQLDEQSSELRVTWKGDS